MKSTFNGGAQNEERQDVYARITNKIVADLEKGVRPWIKPWNAGNTERRIVMPLRSNGVPYRGINVFLLWAEAVAKGYESPFWITLRQANEWNAHVRKGEKSALVVYANSVQKAERNEETGEDVERNIPFLKGYAVFNAEQIEGLSPVFHMRPDSKFKSNVERIHHAELFFRNTGARIRERGGQAYYAQEGDYIQVPPIEAFSEVADFYSTLAHETIHWTKHPSRLARDLGRKVWGDEGYAAEELVAELGSAFLAADLEIRPIPPEENASYIDNWLKVLKGDKRAIFSAASHAQRAADYLHSLQPLRSPVPQPDKGNAVHEPTPMEFRRSLRRRCPRRAARIRLSGGNAFRPPDQNHMSSPGHVSSVITLAEAALELRCSKAHISNVVNGKVPHLPPLPVVRIGRRVLIRHEALLAWIRQAEEASAGMP